MVMLFPFYGILYRSHILDRVGIGRIERMAMAPLSAGVGEGVDLFFVLSGFLITGILLDAKGTPRYFRNFYTRRALRIFPLYYGVLFLVYAVAPLVYPRVVSVPTSIYENWPWAVRYLSNIRDAITGRWVLNSNSNAWGISSVWSLAIEEQFYLAWPLVVFMCRPARGGRGVLGLLATLLALRTAPRSSGGRPISRLMSSRPAGSTDWRPAPCWRSRRGDRRGCGGWSRPRVVAVPACGTLLAYWPRLLPGPARVPRSDRGDRRPHDPLTRCSPRR